MSVTRVSSAISSDDEKKDLKLGVLDAESNIASIPYDSSREGSVVENTKAADRRLL